MAGIIDSVGEHPEYLFDHLIITELAELMKTYFPKEPRCVAIDQFTDKIYVLMVNDDFRSWDVLFCSPDSQPGEQLGWFSYADIGHICGMAIHKKDLYLVSGECCLHHFRLTDFISLIGSKNNSGSGIGEFMGPRQLDISNEGDLYIADFGNNRVQILNRNLKCKRHISHHSMLKPRDVKLTPDEVYVLGDSPEQSTQCIHIFTHMGEKLRSVILDRILNSVQCRGFCIDTYGNVIVIDNATSQIKFFTKEGNLFQTMDTNSTIPYWSKHLIGVAWMSNQKLVVLSKGFRNRLKIFY